MSSSRTSMPATLKRLFRNGLRNMTESIEGVDFAYKFPRSQSDRASMGCSGQLSRQLRGLKGSAVKVLMLDITAHPQRSCRLYASMRQ